MITIDFLSKLRSEVDELLKESDSKRFSILSKSQAGILLGLGGLSKERDQLISLNNPEEGSNLNLILMVRLGATIMVLVASFLSSSLRYHKLPNRTF